MQITQEIRKKSKSKVQGKNTMNNFIGLSSYMKWAVSTKNKEQQEVIVVKSQNNLYLGEIGLQVHVKNKNSNIGQLKIKYKR